LTAQFKALSSKLPGALVIGLKARQIADIVNLPPESGQVDKSY